MHQNTNGFTRSRRRALASVTGAVLAAVLLFAGCGTEDDNTTPTPLPGDETATAEPGGETPTSGPGEESPTRGPDETATPSPGLEAPAEVVLTGPLPDTDATVAPGEGETGRVSIEWEYESEADGFRIYERDCDGEPRGEPIEVGADERMYGPLQPCRPGGEVGVAAFDASGESEIVWAEPGETS